MTTRRLTPPNGRGACRKEEVRRCMASRPRRHPGRRGRAGHTSKAAAVRVLAKAKEAQAREVRLRLSGTRKAAVRAREAQAATTTTGQAVAAPTTAHPEVTASQGTTTAVRAGATREVAVPATTREVAAVPATTRAAAVPREGVLPMPPPARTRF